MKYIKTYEWYIKESPDNISLDDCGLRFSDKDAVAFSYYNDQIMFAKTHLIIRKNIVYDNPELLSKDIVLSDSGRIWFEAKTISFWDTLERSFSKIRFELNKALNKEFGEMIYIDNEWHSTKIDDTWSIDILDKDDDWEEKLIRIEYIDDYNLKPYGKYSTKFIDRQ